MSAKSTAWSVEDLLTACRNLKPKIAAQYGNGNQETLCTTPVIKSVWHNGALMELSTIDGKIGAGYIRVSRESQRSKDSILLDEDEEADEDTATNGIRDGFSEDDQIRRIFAHFVSRKEQFRIFSDCGLSGGLAWDNPDLKKTLWAEKAKRYKDVYESIFLKRPDDKYTPEQHLSMRKYLVETVERIRSTGEDPSIMRISKKDNQSNKTTARYRPGLTRLLDCLHIIHTVAITDLSRLSRSDLLFAYMMRRFESHDIRIVGLIENLDALHAGTAGKVFGAVMSVIAELQLQSVLSGSLRGCLAVLESGRPNGLLPKWVERDSRGYAVLRANKDGTPHGHVKAIRRIVELYTSDDLPGDEKGFTRIASILQAEGYPAPYGGEIWGANSVRKILSNPPITGKQCQFGLEWDVLPKLVSDSEWELIQRKIAKRRNMYYNRKPRAKVSSLMVGLLTCPEPCGRRLIHRKNGTSHQYACKGVQIGHRLSYENHRHVCFLADDVDRFFNELMSTRPTFLLNIFRQISQGQELQDQKAEIEADLLRVREEIIRTQPEKEQEIRSRLAIAGFKADTDNFASMVRSALADAMTDVLRRETQAEEEIEAVNRRIEDYVTASEFSKMTEQAQDWDNLPLDLRNKLLRQIFEEIRVRVEGDRCWLQPVFRVPAEGYAWPIEISTRVSNNGTTTRRLPSVDEWIRSIWANFKVTGIRFPDPLEELEFLLYGTETGEAA